ncbi:hypothetical protein TNCV_3468801 [Trichonephila clavipes]|nr:hypothetical protein TNCV_3468801 [Trichonephila clavipes]
MQLAIADLYDVRQQTFMSSSAQSVKPLHPSCLISFTYQSTEKSGKRPFSRHPLRRQTGPVNSHPVGRLLCLYRLRHIVVADPRPNNNDSEPPALIFKT